MEKYIKMLGFQLNLTFKSNTEKEYLVEDEEFFKQMERTICLIESLKPDIVIYPEMSYSDKYDSTLQELSESKIIIAGSTYIGEINTTIVYSNKKKYYIPKRYASRVEPMSRNIDYIKPEEFIEKYLEEHIFSIKGENIVVFNCMEYYSAAYYTARSNREVFAMICTCSNNNQQVFKEETRAIHNHNTNIYSIVINAKSMYNGKVYGKGNSYIYGPINGVEKDYIKNIGYEFDDHPASIVNLSEEDFYIYTEIRKNLAQYCRADDYKNNPKKIVIER